MRPLRVIAALLASVFAACGGEDAAPAARRADARSADEVFRTPPNGAFHLRADRDVAERREDDGQTTRTYQAVAPVDGVYTLQFASGLTDAGDRPDAVRVMVYSGRAERIVDLRDVPPRLASLVGKDDERSVARIALAVRAREEVTVRAEGPTSVPLTDADGTLHLHVKLFLGAQNASTSVDANVTRRTTSEPAATTWSFVGAEMAHGPATFSRVVDGRPVTLWSCAVENNASGLEMTEESLTLRLRFVPQPVESDHAADGD